MVKQPSVVGIHKIQQIKTFYGHDEATLLWVVSQSHDFLLLLTHWQKSLLAFLAFVMIILLTLIGRTALFDMERLYMLYISLYMCPRVATIFGQMQLPGRKSFFFLLINTMNDLLSMFRSLSLSLWQLVPNSNSLPMQIHNQLPIHKYKNIARYRYDCVIGLCVWLSTTTRRDETPQQAAHFRRRWWDKPQPRGVLLKVCVVFFQSLFASLYIVYIYTCSPYLCI